VKYAVEGIELDFKETVTLPMAEQEMEQLQAFLATYDKSNSANWPGINFLKATQISNT